MYGEIVRRYFECADEVRSFTRHNKSESLTTTTCSYCIGLTIDGIELPKFTCLFFKTLRVRGLVGSSGICMNSDTVILML